MITRCLIGGLITLAQGGLVQPSKPTLALPCQSPELYRRTVQAAHVVSTDSHGEAAKRDLASLLTLLLGAQVNNMSHIGGQLQADTSGGVRLEVVTSDPVTYSTTRIAERGGVVKMSCSRDGTDWVESLSADQWKDIRRLAMESEKETWLGQSVSDAVAIFVTHYEDASCQQFALYSPIFSTKMPKLLREVANHTVKQRLLARRLLSVCNLNLPEPH
jgi:hypothetical protein